MQSMPHTVFLCMKITLIIFVRVYLDRHILGYLQTVSLKPHSFHRIIGKKPHFTHSYFAKNLRTNAIIALIRIVAEMDIGIDSIITLLLELICRYFRHKSYTTALLIEIKHHSFACTLDFQH